MLITAKEWCRSTECCLEVLADISNVITSPIILPPPRSWDASNFELIALEKFYKDILQIDDGFLNVILKELDKKPGFQHSKQLYEMLNKMWPGKLSGDDRDRLGYEAIQPHGNDD